MESRAVDAAGSTLEGELRRNRLRSPREWGLVVGCRRLRIVAMNMRSRRGNWMELLWRRVE